jgi:phosphate/sulfate permease
MIYNIWKPLENTSIDKNITINTAQLPTKSIINNTNSTSNKIPEPPAIASGASDKLNNNSAINNTNSTSNKIPEPPQQVGLYSTKKVNNITNNIQNNTTRLIVLNNDIGTSQINNSFKIIGNNAINTTSIITTKSPNSHEVRLIGLSVLFGILGATIHSMGSLATWVSRQKLNRSYFAWYLIRPLIGGSLAMVVYLLLRASLLSTVVSGSQINSSFFINDFGVAGICAIVGLMTAQMTNKLRDLFDVLFGINKGTDRGDNEEPDLIEEKNGDGQGEILLLSPDKITLAVNEDSVIIAIVKDDQGDPTVNIPIDFGILDVNIALLTEIGHKETDSNGLAYIKIRGKHEGETSIIAITKIKEKLHYISSSINVSSINHDVKNGEKIDNADEKIKEPPKGGTNEQSDQIKDNADEKIKEPPKGGTNEQSDQIKDNADEKIKEPPKGGTNEQSDQIKDNADEKIKD